MNLGVHVNQNSPSHSGWSERGRGWPEPADQSGSSEVYADLLAALDRADVSEALRAALVHALAPPAAPAEPPEVDLSAYAVGGGGGPNLRLRSIGGGDVRRRYTLHLTFPASSLRVARGKAAAYAEALVMLRPELGASPALLSRADQWNHVEPVTCGRPGPVGVTCARAYGHAGCHRDGTASGLCWDDTGRADPGPTAGDPPDDAGRHGPDARGGHGGRDGRDERGDRR